MPTNEERRRIAARLRRLAPGSDWPNMVAEACGLNPREMSNCFHDFTDELCDRLADLIELEERTCRFIEDDELSVGGVRCTVCDEPWFPENGKSRFVYCPKCGTKVVK